MGLHEAAAQLTAELTCPVGATVSGRNARGQYQQTWTEAADLEMLFLEMRCVNPDSVRLIQFGLTETTQVSFPGEQ